MQLTRGLRDATLLALLSAAAAAPAGAAVRADEQTVDCLFQFFTDSHRIAVRSAIGDYAVTLPNDLGLAFHWNNERVVVPAIDAPAGSQEAVDAITTASRPIAGDAYRDFVKVRNEIQGGVRRGGSALDYYVSSESDYLGQQIAASYNRDLMDQHLNLSVGTSWGWDAIRPLADDDSNTGTESKTTLHWNTVATRVIGPSTVVRVGVEQNLVRGLQHNPYRNVYAGGTNVPERHPDARRRTDAFVRLHQYLDNRSSLKVAYRLYSDDWGIESHETSARLSQYVTRGVFVRYAYRWYTQSSAYFHRDQYASTNGVDGYLTGDYRMGDLAAHLFGASLHADLEGLPVGSETLRRTGVWVSYERYFNSNNYSSNTFTTGLQFRF